MSKFPKLNLHWPYLKCQTKQSRKLSEGLKGSELVPDAY